MLLKDVRIISNTIYILSGNLDTSKAVDFIQDCGIDFDNIGFVQGHNFSISKSHVGYVHASRGLRALIEKVWPGLLDCTSPYCRKTKSPV